MRLSRSSANTQPQLHPALLRLSAIVSQYFTRDLTNVSPRHLGEAEGVAVCHGLSRVVGKTRDGRKLDMWWRTTYGLRKVADSWLIAHVHSSVPFDPSTGAQSGQTTPRAHARAERFNGSARQATEHCSH